MLRKTNESYEALALIIDGKSLTYALEDDVKNLFLELAIGCASVICCRASPKQKALVSFTFYFPFSLLNFQVRWWISSLQICVHPVIFSQFIAGVDWIKSSIQLSANLKKLWQRKLVSHKRSRPNDNSQPFKECELSSH